MSAQVGFMRPLINYGSQIQEAPQVFRAMRNNQPISWAPLSKLAMDFGVYSSKHPTTDKMSEKAKIALLASATLTTIFVVSFLAVPLTAISYYAVTGVAISDMILNALTITYVAAYLLSCVANSILKSEQDRDYPTLGSYVGASTLLCDLWNGKESTWNNKAPLTLTAKIAIYVESFFDKLSLISCWALVSSTCFFPGSPIVTLAGIVYPIAQTLWIAGFALKAFMYSASCRADKPPLPV